MVQPVKVSDATVLAARRMGEELSSTGKAKPLSACLESVDSAAGRKRLAKYLDSLPFPHYEPAPKAPGLLVRIDADGKRTVGRFVHGQFRLHPGATQIKA